MVCPKCRQVYVKGEQVCPVDGTPLVADAGEGYYDRTTPAPPGSRQERSTVRESIQRRRDPSDTGAPNGDEGPSGRSLTDSTPDGHGSTSGRSLTDSSRNTSTGREISTPRMVVQDIQISPGDLIADYQVTGQIGEGGMGTVFAGIQPVIGKPVAIKVLLREFASNAEVVNRFIQEARAANQARSRYIVDIFSFGELNDGRHYFVMEHLDGQSLRELLNERKVVAFDEAYGILACLAKGLIAAHTSGIIHRDIKPENIMVMSEEDGTVIAKLLDFGIAKLQGSMANPDFVTKTGAAMGTPFYMSPEQCRGVDVDHRTDIYALGIIMFEMFTGQLPFKASSYIELVNKHLFASPPDMRSLNPEASAQLEAFVQRCIAKNPEERPSTMRQFLSELTELVPSLHRTQPSGAGLRPLAGVPISDTSVPSVVTGPGMEPPRRKGRLGLVLGALAVLVLGAGGAGTYLIWNKGQTGGGPPVVPVVQPTTPDAAPREKARLELTTKPPGAAVFVDGKELPGKSPLELELPPGKVQLRIVLEGHVTIDEPMELESGKTRSMSYTLTARETKQTGGLKVATNVAHATFFLDGNIVYQGKTLMLDQLEAKAYSLKITARGRRPLERAITIRPGDEALMLDLRLKRSRGRPGKRPTPKTKKGTTNDDPDSTLDPFGKNR